jgi:hypothetical protein
MNFFRSTKRKQGQEKRDEAKNGIVKEGLFAKLTAKPRTKKLGYFAKGNKNKGEPNTVRGPYGLIATSAFNDYVKSGKAIPIITNSQNTYALRKNGVVNAWKNTNGNFASLIQGNMYSRKFQGKNMFTNADLKEAAFAIYKNKSIESQVMKNILYKSSSSQLIYPSSIKGTGNSINVSKLMNMASGEKDVYYTPDKKMSRDAGHIELIPVKIPGTSGTIRISVLTEEGEKHAQHGMYPKMETKSILNSISTHSLQTHYKNNGNIEQIPPLELNIMFQVLPTKAKQRILASAVKQNILGTLSKEFEQEITKFKNAYERGDFKKATEAAGTAVNVANVSLKQAGEAPTPASVNTAKKMGNVAAAATKTVVEGETPNQTTENRIRELVKAGVDPAKFQKLFNESQKPT